MGLNFTIKVGSRYLDTLEAISRAFLWTIWNYRNDVIFNTNTKVKSPFALAYDVKALAFLWIRIRAKWGRNMIWNFWVENPLYCTM